jgi:hypothetical protein
MLHFFCKSRCTYNLVSTKAILTKYLILQVNQRPRRPSRAEPYMGPNAICRASFFVVQNDFSAGTEKAGH